MIPMLYDCFKHWAATGSVYLISDPHFDDADCRLMDPNWPRPQEYVDIINTRVKKNDTLICLGDCGNIEWFKKIKAGYKVLIKGNHDDKGNAYYKSVFDEVYAGPLWIAPKILLSHEPIVGECWYNLHGHVHNGEIATATSFNIAADVANWEVISLGDMIKLGAVANIKDIHRVTIDKAGE